MAKPSLSEIYKRQEPASLAGAEMAARVLREAIVTGVIQGGAAIKQDEVAQTLKTSKAPLREALRQLESEGLVTFINYRGFFVAEMSRSEMEEAFRIRAELEPLAIELAMPMMTKTDTDLAGQHLRQMETVRDSSWLCRLNLSFHSALYRPSRAPHLLNMIEHAHYVSHRYVHAQYSRFIALPLSQDEHASILGACVSRNGPRAKLLIREHILGALDQLKKDLEPLFEEGGKKTPAASRRAVRRP